MDYLEGFLIGPVWSDTDYKSHRHFNAHLFLAFLMALAFAGVVFYPIRMNKWIFVAWPASFIILIALVLITPFLSSYYYRLPIYVRPFVLLLYAFKYVLLFYVLTHYFLPLATLDSKAIPMMLLERMDRHVNHMIDIIAETGGIFRTVLGIVAGTMWIIGEGLLLMIVVIAIPLAAIGVLKGVQYLLDWIVNYVLYQPINEGVPVRISERTASGDVFDSLSRKPALNVEPDIVDIDSPQESTSFQKQNTLPRHKLKREESYSQLRSLVKGSRVSKLKDQHPDQYADPYVEEDVAMYPPEADELMAVPEPDDGLYSSESDEQAVAPELDDGISEADFGEEIKEPESDDISRMSEIDESAAASEPCDVVCISEPDETPAREFDDVMCTPELDEPALAPK